MMAHLSQYGEVRSPSPSTKLAQPSRKSIVSKSKKGKINFVSKASLATFDPRHAMGIDTGNDWLGSGSCVSSARSSLDESYTRSRRYSQDNVRAPNWTESPTPELEAFAASMEDYAYGPSGNGSEISRQPSASSSVFEDERDTPEEPARRRFYSRKSVATAASTAPTDELLFSPLGSQPKGLHGAGTTVTRSSTSSSFARFFSRKKKDKVPHLGGLASRSTPNLFAGLPQSAPPTTLTFEQSGFQFSPQRKASDGSSIYSPPSSFPTSPEGKTLRLINGVSPSISSSSHFSNKKNMPALRQIREAHSGLSSPAKQTFSAPKEEYQRPRQSMAIARSSEVSDVAPALPPLSSFSASSPMIPLEFSWDSKRRTARESQMPAASSSNRPISRVVSTVGRGVPSPNLTAVRMNDLRKSTITLRNEPTLRFAEDTKMAPTNPTVGKPLGSSRSSVSNQSKSEKRLSMTQRVVNGLLDQNHGGEEPEMRARRSDMEVRSARRRSRSADGRTLPLQRQYDYTSSPSSNSHSDSVFLAFVRHAPAAPGRANSPQPRFFTDSEHATTITPTVKQQSSFSTPIASSPNRSVAQKQSPAGRSPQRQTAIETHQARRVNFASQRAKAVAVSSPLLLSRNSFVPMSGGRNTPLPVVNIMPPTPDLGSLSGEDERIRPAHTEVEPEPVVVEAPKVVKVARAVKKAPEAPNVVQPAVVKVAESLPSREQATTPIPQPVVSTYRAAAPSQEPVQVRAPEATSAAAQPAPVEVKSPESVYSPASIYSPETHESAFASMHAGLFGNDEALSKDEMDITADSIAAELSFGGLPRTDSVTSQLSEASNRSSSSGVFAFSRSMSSSSLFSGGTFSSASSSASESPERKLASLSGSDSFDFAPSRMASSTSLASTTATSIFEQEGEATKADGVDSSAAVAQGKLKMPFQFKGSETAGGDSSDCDTPTLASCRQMGATTVAQKQQSDMGNLSRQLGLSMDLSDLAQELGLGRLSQIGLGHLKGIESLAEQPPVAVPEAMTMGSVDTGLAKRVVPVKPPRSAARANGKPSPAVSGLSRFGSGTNYITSSAAMSPLPVSIAGRPPQTPPRNRARLAKRSAPGSRVSASGVPKVDGGFGLGLNFVETPSPQKPASKAAINAGSYNQHIVEQLQLLPINHYHHDQQPFHSSLAYEDESEWVGVAM